MLASEDLNDAAAGGIAPEHQVAKRQLLNDTLEIADVILDEVTSLRIPARVAVAAHVDREHAVIRGESRREMIERTRVAIKPVNHDHRRLSLPAPVDVVNAKTIDVEEAIRRLS